MIMSKKERLVAAIESGTVIDHIPAEKTFQVVNLLQLQKLSTPVTIGFNFSSKMVGTKGIIKVSDKFFTDDEISRLSVVAPNVVLNIINDYEVVEKKKVVTPDELRSIVRCNNPKCITNNEPMDTIFHVVDKEHGILKCHYCDKEQEMEKVELVQNPSCWVNKFISRQVGEFTSRLVTCFEGKVHMLNYYLLVI